MEELSGSWDSRTGVLQVWRTRWGKRGEGGVSNGESGLLRYDEKACFWFDRSREVDRRNNYVGEGREREGET